MPAQLLQGTLPPPQPRYIFRGHTAQVHAVCFVRQNTRLLTGDANGWTIIWDTSTKRPVAVWQAHRSAILGLSAWGDDKIITHGRDNKLVVWQVREADELGLSKTLPLAGEDEDGTPTVAAEDDTRTQPWILHSLSVNALNFCSFAKCALRGEDGEKLSIAVPGPKEGDIVIYSLPDESLYAYIQSPKTETSHGMIMALGLRYHDSRLRVFAGHEDGETIVWQEQHSRSGVAEPSVATTRHWIKIYASKPHSQPILSLDTAPGSADTYFTSGADSVIARHTIEHVSAINVQNKRPTPTPEILQTHHAGQQALRIRSDGRIMATAGWDGRVRVYSAAGAKTRELAVLKWHKEGCYAVGFADVGEAERGGEQDAALLEADEARQEDREAAAARTADSDAAQQLVHTTMPARTSSHQRQRRRDKAQSTHWLAAGSKDGKVSLWDIY